MFSNVQSTVHIWASHLILHWAWKGKTAPSTKSSQHAVFPTWEPSGENSLSLKPSLSYTVLFWYFRQLVYNSPVSCVHFLPYVSEFLVFGAAKTKALTGLFVFHLFETISDLQSWDKMSIFEQHFTDDDIFHSGSKTWQNHVFSSNAAAACRGKNNCFRSLKGKPKQWAHRS